ncbi:MAG: hypothetical protein U0931_14490 [Vulcanimicrobiota bacterium]
MLRWAGMLTSVKIFGFEPAIQAMLRLMLSKEPGLSVAGEDADEADVLLFRPEDPESIFNLRIQFPIARFVAVLDWHRRSSFAGAPVDEYVDPLAGYESLVASIRP